MPIVRTYACAECNHMMEVVLSADDWDAPPPECPMCQEREMRQEFKPVAIGGSVRSRAAALAEDIAANDYHVADMQRDKYKTAPTVRYKDQTAGVVPSTWAGAQGMLEQAITIGRDTRLRHGNGLDVLQNALKTGAQPDLIAASKRRAIKVW
jgi:putative FmdB family regulatory protein